ncbi:MAG: hypothetical protein AAGC60_13690 [Acidobacteriota bacterium]
MFRMNRLLVWIAIALFVSVPLAWAEKDPDNEPEKLCDGLDNDGDGVVDDGFDTDGDGVARCCDGRPFFVTMTIGGNELFAHHNRCSNSFDTAPAPLASLPPGQRIRVNGVADITGSTFLDVVWTHVETDRRYIATCNGREWVSLLNSEWTYNYFGGADLDHSGVVDFVAWDLRNSPVTGPVQGPGPELGVTALFGAGTYTENYGSWDPDPVLGDWVATRTYNAQDLDQDCKPDIVFFSYADGGASETKLHWAPGNGSGFDASIELDTITGQPQNWGDLGDIDCDGCADWVGGPDDDGDRGAVYAGFGDCNGNLSLTSSPIIDACVGGCPGSGPSWGRGYSQLYDWNCDGRLDLLTSHVEDTGSTATVQYWPGECDGFGGASVVIGGGTNAAVIASPLRN